MAIYTRMGAPVQIVDAELRKRWWALFNGRTKVWDKKPTPAQLNGAKETDEFDMWWIRAKQIGAYPDGTGADRIGKMLEYGTGEWLDENEFRADDGIREIHAECEMKADDKSRKIIEGRRALTGVVAA